MKYGQRETNYRKMKELSNVNMKRNQVVKNESVSDQSKWSEKQTELKRGIHPSCAPASVRHK